jgi:NADH-quinone oxidoreductase subunit L
VQNDIKRIIAYSTCSQLGYMFFAAGVGFTRRRCSPLHPCLLQGAAVPGRGSVIHAMSDEQDIRRMGGIWRKIPVTYAVMWIGSLALAGIPIFAGYYSKDAILEGAIAAHSAWALRLRLRHHRRLPDRLLLLAPAHPHLPRRAARRRRTWRMSTKPAGDAGAAAGPGRRRVATGFTFARTSSATRRSLLERPSSTSGQAHDGGAAPRAALGADAGDGHAPSAASAGRAALRLSCRMPRASPGAGLTVPETSGTSTSCTTASRQPRAPSRAACGSGRRRAHRRHAQRRRRLAAGVARGTAVLQNGRVAHYAFAMILGLVLFVTIFLMGR